MPTPLTSCSLLEVVYDLRGEVHAQIFDLSKAEVKVEEKIRTNIYRKIVRRKLVARTFFWQNILCTPKNLPAPTPMLAGLFTVMVCGNVPE